MRTPSSSRTRSSRTSSFPEGHCGYRIVDEARIGPRLGDLGVEDARELDAALAAWHRVATRDWAHEHWLAVESLQPIRGRLAVVERHLRERGRRLGLEDTWKLVNAPIDPDGAEILGLLALAVAGDRDQRHLLQFLLDPRRLRDASLEEAEEAGRVAAILRWFALQYPGVGGVTIERAAALEQAAAERVVRRLAVEVRDGKLGRCRSCGQSCPPWYPLCDRCARAGRASGADIARDRATVDELRDASSAGRNELQGLARVAACAAELEADDGQVLALQDDPGSGMYVIREGTVAVELRSGTLELGPGDFFGELALLIEDGARVARVRATSPVRCLSIPREDFLALVETRAELRALAAARARPPPRRGAGRRLSSVPRPVPTLAACRRRS